MSKWSHLANAKHIDLIIAHIKANPTAWDEELLKLELVELDEAAFQARKAALGYAWLAVKDKSCDSARNAVWATVWNSPMDANMDAAMDAADGAALALVAWDHASGLMDLPAEQVKVLALLGNQAAILLYPAIAVMETTQEVA